MGLPPIVVMVLPFMLGLILEFLIKKFLKIAIIATVIVVLIRYFGLCNLSRDSLKNIEARYGSVAIHYTTLLIGVLPFSIGFITGLIVGFLFG